MDPTSSLAMPTLPAHRVRKLRVTWLPGAALAAAAVTFVLAFFVAPVAIPLSYSMLIQDQNGAIGLPLTFSHYAHLLETPLYRHVLFVTLRISLWTAVTAMLLGLPVVLVLVREHPAIGLTR